MVGTAALRAYLARVIAGLDPGDDFQVHLFQNDVELTPVMELADFTECDFTGYVPVTVTPAGSGVPFDNPDGDALLSFGSAHFQPTATTVTNTAFGWYLTNQATDLSVCVLQAVKFPAGVPMMSTADAIDVVAHLMVGQPITADG